MIDTHLPRGQRVLAALDPVAVVLHFEDHVDDFPLADMVKRRLKEFPLPQRRHIGNDDDEARVDWRSAVERKEIRSIVGHERIAVLQDCLHQVPVFRTTETEIGHVVRSMSGSMRQFDQGGMQALVDEEFRWQQTLAQATARRCRVMRTGFLFAQGRCAGRPRRGNAAT